MRLATESELDLLLASVPPPVTDSEFRACRNEIVRTLSEFGSAGPMGVQDDNGDEVQNFGDIDSNFYIVDDQYNDAERIHLVESDPQWITERVLQALGGALTKHPNWSAHFALGDAGLYVFAGLIVPQGRRFWDCDSVRSIADRCSRPIDFGPPPPLWPEAYSIWRDLVCGEWSPRELPPAPDRQWKYSLDLIRRTDQPSQFTYGSTVAHVLHPSTRFSFVTRFLDEFASGLEQSSTGLGTTLDEAGRLIVRVNDDSAARLFERLRIVQAMLRGEESFGFWTSIVGGANKENGRKELARRRLTGALVDLTVPECHALVRLSALYGLAYLDDSTAAAVAKRVRSEKAVWPEAINEWFREVEEGYGGNPDLAVFEVISSIA